MPFDCAHCLNLLSTNGFLAWLNLVPPSMLIILTYWLVWVWIIST